MTYSNLQFLIEKRIREGEAMERKRMLDLEN